MAIVTPPAEIQELTGPKPEGGRSRLMDFHHRITVDEYHQILESGALGPEPRVELLEGVILDKMTKNPPHNLACDLLQHQLSALIPPGFFLSMATSMTIEDRQGEPEPDAWILRGAPRDYAGRRRTPTDSPLVIEVADTSYELDRHQKLTTYAASGIPIYWLIDLNRRRIEVHGQPGGQGSEAYYAQTRIYAEEEHVPLVLDGKEHATIAVRELLP
ncbi:MAG: Uma2 family endonuclease [Isosphaeraceae bacterium]